MKGLLPVFRLIPARETDVSLLFEQCLADLHQLIPDPNMLRTDFLAFSALDTFVRVSAAMTARIRPKPSFLIVSNDLLMSVSSC